MKSDKEKNDFYEETKHRGCLQECSQILMPPGLYTGDRLPGDKKRSIPCGTDPENSKNFFCYYQLLAGSLPAATSSATFCCSCLIF